MDVKDQGVLITGGASGLGLATARHLVRAGAYVVVADLPQSPGAQVVAELDGRGRFVAADVADPEQVRAAVTEAAQSAPLRGVVHTAGRGGAVRLVDKDGSAGDAGTFAEIVRVNLLGSYHVASIAAAAMADNEPSPDRGVIVLTASVAAFEGQIGQAGYAASKAGIVGLTLCAARDLATRQIRVCTIAPGVMDTPMLGRLRDDVKESLSTTVPYPRRLGQPEEYALLAHHILENGYLNGETIRLDGAIRMTSR